MEMFSICWPQSDQPLLIQEVADPARLPRRHDGAADCRRLDGGPCPSRDAQ